MLETHEIFYSISTLLYGITSVIMVIASFVLFLKHKSAGTTLMVIGATVSLLFLIIEKILFFAASELEIYDLINYQGIMYIFGNLGMLLFVFGLCMFSYQTNFSKKTN